MEDRSDNAIALIEGESGHCIDECLRLAREANRESPRDWRMLAYVLKSGAQLASAMARIEPRKGKVQFSKRGSIPQ
jgi:hypothetical protein